MFISTNELTKHSYLQRLRFVNCSSSTRRPIGTNVSVVTYNCVAIAVFRDEPLMQLSPPGYGLLYWSMFRWECNPYNHEWRVHSISRQWLISLKQDKNSHWRHIIQNQAHVHVPRTNTELYTCTWYLRQYLSNYCISILKLAYFNFQGQIFGSLIIARLHYVCALRQQLDSTTHAHRPNSYKYNYVP